MKFVQGIIAVLLVVAVSGCGDRAQEGPFEFGNLQTKRGFEDTLGWTYDLTDPALHDAKAVSAMESKGTPFQRNLHAEYVSLAEKEQGEGEKSDARRFLQRAALSADGEKVLPEDASTRLLEPRVAASMRRHRDSLVGMLYRLDGVNREPSIAAHAQAMFDCWQEEVEEGDAEGIKQCRDAFMADMAALAPKKMAMASKAEDKPMAKPMPAAPAPATRYILLFKTDTTILEAESIPEKDRLMADIAGRSAAPQVSIVGHADRVGSVEYNEKLSRRRADYVRQELIKAGVPGDNISVNWQGETDPAVDTADNVPETANRRVEVSIR